MSAPGEDDTFPEDRAAEMEEMADVVSDDDDDEGVEMEDGDAEEGAEEKKVYVPGMEPLAPGQELEMDHSAYRMYHECQTGAPCLSFDVVRDDDGDTREQYPLSMLLCAGTQADTAIANRLLVMRMHNLHGTLKDSGEEESSDEDSDEDEEDEQKKPQMELAMLPHYGGINRVRVTRLPGRLVSGDCKKNIHVWEPQEGGASWKIDQRPFSSHSKSVEDLQWSPTEATALRGPTRRGSRDYWSHLRTYAHYRGTRQRPQCLLPPWERQSAVKPAPRPALPPWERQSPVKSGSPDPRCDASVEKAEPGKERLPRPALRCLFPVRAVRGTETRFGSPGRDEARINTVARTLSGSMRSIMIKTRSH
ncbi:hypothetical protein WMY93_025922 [Mugilogobius chulae]|uniref:Histone-binding protein RBBP4-like N-terminal domain-containing protein n=1 Tax=Mugilogobius chulae TaxID=88201 RepID=A0AAW0N6A2_9GOBI